MLPNEKITISTKRLTLRFLTDADIPALFEIYSHPEVMRYWSWPAWTELAQARQMVLDARDDHRTHSALQFGIVRSEGLHLVGSCSLFHFHFTSRRAEIGYALGRPYWRQGYMHEALAALIEYAFQVLDLNRLEADIDPRNHTSARTLDRLGFQKEGHLRERWIVNEEISNTWFYGLLRREWLEQHHPT